MPRPGGGRNYSSDEVEVLLEVVERILPLGSNCWDRVACEFNIARPRGTDERDGDSLKRKFKALYGVRKPTGDPTIPPQVRRAKLIKRMIDNRGDTFDTSESISTLNHSNDGNNDDKMNVRRISTTKSTKVLIAMRRKKMKLYRTSLYNLKSFSDLLLPTLVLTILIYHYVQAIYLM